MLANGNSNLNHFSIKYGTKSNIAQGHNFAKQKSKQLLTVQDGQWQGNVAPGDVKKSLNEECIDTWVCCKCPGLPDLNSSRDETSLVFNKPFFK